MKQTRSSTSKSSTWALPTWQRFLVQNGLGGVSVARGVTFDSASLGVQYALSGQGLVLADPALFREEMKAAAWLRRSPHTITKASAIT